MKDTPFQERVHSDEKLSEEELVRKFYAVGMYYAAFLFLFTLTGTLLGLVCLFFWRSLAWAIILAGVGFLTGIGAGLLKHASLISGLRRK
jgi:hypothetical protein